MFTSHSTGTGSCRRLCTAVISLCPELFMACCLRWRKCGMAQTCSARILRQIPERQRRFGLDHIIRYRINLSHFPYRCNEIGSAVCRDWATLLCVSASDMQFAHGRRVPVLLSAPLSRVNRLSKIQVEHMELRGRDRFHTLL